MRTYIKKTVVPLVLAIYQAVAVIINCYGESSFGQLVLDAVVNFFFTYGVMVVFCWWIKRQKVLCFYYALVILAGVLIIVGSKVLCLIK